MIRKYYNSDDRFRMAYNYFKKYVFDAICDNDKVDLYWIAGGALREYFSKGKVESDFDVFFKNENDMKNCAIEFVNNRAKVTFNNDDITNYQYKGKKIQFIKRFYFDNPIETIEEFDFTVACCAVTNEGLFYFHDNFFVDLAKKSLVINNLPFPLSTLERLQKYINKGFHICNGGLLEIAKAIKNVDFEDANQNSFEFYPDKSIRFLRFD